MSQDLARSTSSDESQAEVQSWADRPVQQIFDELVADGIINERGEVLVRMPSFGPVRDETDNASAPGLHLASPNPDSRLLSGDGGENPFRDIMSDEDWQAARALAQRPAQEQWDELVADGIINERGEVLVRMPSFGPDDDEDDAGDGAPAREAT